jgi:uncharacterized protein YbjT (DUF2867 family)
MMRHQQPDSILVTGATGKTGSRVAYRLRERGIPVRAASRQGIPPFDWERPDTWLPALEGARAAYISYFPDLAAPGATEAVGAFARLAVEREVPRLVLLSGRGEEEAQRAERAVQDSGAEWTAVRCSWFAQNFSEGYLLDAVLAGEVALPVDRVPEPFVDVEDIADVAVAALITRGHEGQVYELTGPRLVTFAEAVGEIAGATGRPVRFVPVELEQFAAGMADQRVPGEVISLLAYLFTEVLDGRNAHLSDGVQRVLGRAPRDFREYVRRIAASGVWDL